MDFDLDALDLNWVNDIINEDVGGDGNGAHETDPSPPSWELFANHQPSESLDAPPPSNWLALGPVDSVEERSRIFKERLSQALRCYFKQSAERHALVQVWVPVQCGRRWVLTTSGQPFVLGLHSRGLSNYRTVSVSYLFPATEEDCMEDYVLGLPGRVFRQKMPEWTPNVQYYSSEEYPRLCHALHYDVRGSLALPVFESSRESCVGVVEIILTSTKVNYAPEVDRVCKALEAVNLKSSEALDHPQLQICSEGHQAALAEILEIITVVCETHRLPLAQTWVSCMQHHAMLHGGGSQERSTSFDSSCMGLACVSTSDIAFYVVDAHMWGFRDACAEHHLQKGHGVPGRVFAAHVPCFSCDITEFSKKEYPLVHYARMFGLVGSLAIYLESGYTGKEGYVLEFFLPPNVKDIQEQQYLLESLLTTLKQCCHSLRVVLDYELVMENVFPSSEPSEKQNYYKSENTMNIVAHCQLPPQSPETDVYPVAGNVQLEGNRLSLSADHSFHVVADSSAHENGLTDTDVNLAHASAPDNASLERLSRSRRSKTEKSISLEVLQQYFAGSLKNAAKSLGVCPTTMKRICRQYGITRWPSRKIKKVNRSICKLQRVIESVQVAQGAFSLASLLSPLPVTVGSSCSLSQNVKEPRQDFTFIEPHNFVGTSGRESLPESNPVYETVAAETEKSEKRIVNHDYRGSQPEFDEHSPVSQSKSESQSIEAAASRESSQDTPLNIEATELVSRPSTSHTLEQERVTFNDAIGYGLSAPEEQCPTANKVPSCSVRNETSPNVMAVKAMYKEDIVRFRLPSMSRLIELREEVAKRLKLEVGIFDVKYLDDDQEWVLLACEDDFQECIDISKSCGKHLIRLLIGDVIPNLGSSSESSGGLT